MFIFVLGPAINNWCKVDGKKVQSSEKVELQSTKTCLVSIIGVLRGGW